MVIHPSLDIGIHITQDAPRVSVDGEVDASTAAILLNAVTSVLTSLTPDRLIVDLSRARFFSTSGLAVLITLRDRLLPLGGELVIVAAEGTVAHRVVTRTGLDSVFTLVG
jgi:anti-anti-sigma factor